MSRVGKIVVAWSAQIITAGMAQSAAEWMFPDRSPMFYLMLGGGIAIVWVYTILNPLDEWSGWTVGK